VVSDGAAQSVGVGDGGVYVAAGDGVADAVEGVVAVGVVGGGLWSRGQQAGNVDVAVVNGSGLERVVEVGVGGGATRGSKPCSRLTLQLRPFVTLLGLNYEYPVDEIVADDSRFLDTIDAHDLEDAVAAWRGETDNCARHMMGFIDQRPRR
jgi:hypothetical protein